MLTMKRICQRFILALGVYLSLSLSKRNDWCKDDCLCALAMCIESFFVFIHVIALAIMACLAIVLRAAVQLTCGYNKLSCHTY